MKFRILKSTSILLGFPLYLAKRMANNLLPHPLLGANKKFKNIHRGETCFILGSGPSIKKQDLTKLSTQIVMTQNHFHAHQDIKTINPRYHVLVPKYQPKEYDDNWRDWLRSMDERLPENCLLFADSNTKYLIEEFQTLKDRAYYIHTGINSIYMRTALVDLTKNIMSVPTALTECLTIALYMGFQKIYLLGFDLNQQVLLRDEQYGRDRLRFYGMSPITNNVSEAKFEEEFASTGDDWFQMWQIWVALILLQNYAIKNDIKIINATEGGLLDVFPRQRYEDIIK